MPILPNFVLAFQKYRLFSCTVLSNTKHCVSEKCRHHIYPCFVHCTAKNKDIALKYYLRVVCTYLYNICIAVWVDWEKLSLLSNYL